MSPRSRIAPVSMVSAVGIVIAMGLPMWTAPLASADPCTGASAGIQPPASSNTNATPDLPTNSNGRPVGQRPTGANPNAPLPRLGQISRSVLRALTPQSARVEKQAGTDPDPAPAPVNQAPPAAQMTPAPAAPPPPSPPGTSLVGWVTGPQSPNNTVAKFAITGTDLGIMWDNGGGTVMMAFGDTYGYCSVKGQQWRYNALFRSNDDALSDTVKVASAPLWAPGLAKQVVNTTRWAPTETGIIPTAGIADGGKQYMTYMSIKHWDNAGSWTTNYSAVAVSPDNGERWGVYPDSVRTSGPDNIPNVAHVPGNENFQMGAFMKPGPGDPYVYYFGTPAGRSGSAYIARVPHGFIPDLRRYEYWNSDQNAWVPANPGAATPVIPGPVGEMSAQYNTYLRQYVSLYCNGANDVVMRTAPAPQGPWSPESVLVPSGQFPGGIYAPYLHPWSVGRDLYYNLSLWSEYNVMLMKTTLP